MSKNERIPLKPVATNICHPGTLRIINSIQKRRYFNTKSSKDDNAEIGEIAVKIRVHLLDLAQYSLITGSIPSHNFTVSVCHTATQMYIQMY